MFEAIPFCIVEYWNWLLNATVVHFSCLKYSVLPLLDIESTLWVGVMLWLRTPINVQFASIVAVCETVEWICRLTRLLFFECCVWVLRIVSVTLEQVSLQLWSCKKAANDTEWDVWANLGFGFRCFRGWAFYSSEAVLVLVLVAVLVLFVDHPSRRSDRMQHSAK